MPDWLANFVKQFAALSAGRQAMLVMTAIGSLAFFFWISNGARSGDYRLLYRGLDEMETAQIVDGLTAEGIDFELAEGGTAVRVPAPRVQEARMRMASRGLPNGSTPGFELFDKGSFGVTDYVQKINFHRALQGELSRTIEQVEGVEKARVQLAIPQRKNLLRRDQRHPTASIVTRLRAGWDLEPTQVRGIVHLVASSVEGLEVSRVTLVDNHGRLLAPQADMDLAGRGSSASVGAERRIESELENQIESILERTVGLGRVVAKVSADLDWTQTERTEEVFDPDSQVARSSQRDNEFANESGGEGGVAGIIANSPDVAAASGATGSGTSSNRTSETVNYEISKTVSRHVLPMGNIQRLSIAVLVDGKSIAVPDADGANGEVEGEIAFTPWEADELKEFEELAKRAVGYSADRGDEISVINAPFIELDAETVDDGGLLTPDILVLLTSLLHGVAFLIGLVLFSKMFIRPLAAAVGGGDTAALEDLREEVMKKLSTVNVERVEGASGGNLSEAELDMNIPGLEEENDEMSLQQQVDRLAQRRADDSVRTIRGWMATGG